MAPCIRTTYRGRSKQCRDGPSTGRSIADPPPQGWRRSFSGARARRSRRAWVTSPPRGHRLPSRVQPMKPPPLSRRRAAERPAVKAVAKSVADARYSVDEKARDPCAQGEARWPITGCRHLVRRASSWPSSTARFTCPTSAPCSTTRSTSSRPAARRSPGSATTSTRSPARLNSDGAPHPVDAASCTGRDRLLDTAHDDGSGDRRRRLPGSRAEVGGLSDREHQSSRATTPTAVLAYLYDTGRANEHTDQHLVASWDDFASPTPAAPGLPRSQAATRPAHLEALDLRVKQARSARRRNGTCGTARCAPPPRTASSPTPSGPTIARRVVHATGIAPDGDPDGCRWVAVRHAEDHIHIAATKVRGDLRTARNWNDYLTAAMNELTAIEKDFGLTRVARGPSRDRSARSAPPGPSRRRPSDRATATTARERLRTTVRTASPPPPAPDEFFNLLAAPPVFSRNPALALRRPPRLQGRPAATHGTPIWFSGSSLATDLSLPRSDSAWRQPKHRPRAPTRANRAAGTRGTRPPPPQNASPTTSTAPTTPPSRPTWPPSAKP